MSSSSIIEVAGVSIAVEMRDIDAGHTEGIEWVTRPLPIDQWPLATADIQRRVTAVFAASGCRATYADVEWAANKAGLDYQIEQDRYMFRALPTAAQEAGNRRAGYDEAEDGLCR
jgi:hypothetical protein